VASLTGCGLLPRDEQVTFTEKDLRMPAVSAASRADRDRSDMEFQNLIKQTAVSSTRAVQKLSQLERAAKPYVRPKPAPNPVKLGMDQRVSIDWTGPVEPVLQRLAENAHYRVNTLGQAPVVPILVSLNRQNTFLSDVIQDISYQIQRQADINIVASEKLIELRYRR
tara:strand:+ start:3340 stop:3840 length:501 start_codon:yes stop_codon:yes gene_type:complete